MTQVMRKGGGKGGGKETSKAKAEPKGKATDAKAAAEPELSATHKRLLKRMQVERTKLVHQAEELEAEQRALAEDPDAAEISSDVESGDCVASRERDVDLRVSAHVDELIAQIDRAIEKLHTGRYGTCERCGARIPRARLDAVPYAELCVECQQLHERLYF